MKVNLFFLIFLFVISLLSCNNHKQSDLNIYNFSQSETISEEWKEKASQMVDKWNNRKMILFNNPPSKSPIKIVTYIDATCSACLVNFGFWEKFINQIQNSRLNCDFIIYVSAKDELSISQLGFTHPFILDNERQFIGDNELWDKRFQSALLDENDKVILIGDPTMNIKLEKLYMKAIKKLGK